MVLRACPALIHSLDASLPSLPAFNYRLADGEKEKHEPRVLPPSRVQHQHIGHCMSVIGPAVFGVVHCVFLDRILQMGQKQCTAYDKKKKKSSVALLRGENKATHSLETFLKFYFHVFVRIHLLTLFLPQTFKTLSFRECHHRFQEPLNLYLQLEMFLSCSF